jgi:hypothetical protein
MNARRRAGAKELIIPIVMTSTAGGRETWIALSSPIAPNVPTEDKLRAATVSDHLSVVCVDDLLVRRNLPAAIRNVRASLT